MGAAGLRVEWPLVGRSTELQKISDGLVAQPPVGAVLTAPAGQGKTRLAHEALRLAADAGMTTLLALGTRSASTIALGALGHLLPPARRRPEREVDLIARVGAAIAAQAGRAGVALLVDDAHLVDDATATVVHQLAMTGTAAVLVTIRDDADTPDPILALWKEGLAERIEISPLNPAEVEAFAAEILGDTLVAAAAQQLHEASLGNPLYVRELVLGARDAGYLVPTSRGWMFTARPRSSSRLAELIRARLGQLSDDERAALEILSVAGHLRFDLVAGLVVPEALASLERRRLIAVERDDAVATVSLSHAVHGDVVREAMGQIRTLAVNRALADAVDAEPAPRREDVLRAAVWRLDGGGTPHVELMAEAARMAFFARDEALALRLASTARAAGAGVEAALIEAQALTTLGRAEEAISLLQAHANDASSEEQHALVAIERSAGLFFVLGRADEAAAVLVDALDRCSGQAWRDEILVQRAELDMLAGRPREAIALCEEVLERGAGRTVVVAASAAGPALAVAGRGLDAAAMGARGLVERAALGPQDSLADPGLHQVVQAFGWGEAGQLLLAESTAMECLEDARSVSDGPRQAWAALVAGRVLLQQGRLASAASCFLEADALFADLRVPDPRRWAIAGWVIASAMASDAHTSNAANDVLDALPVGPMLLMESEVERARAWHRHVVGDPRGAARALWQAADRAESSGALSLLAAALHDIARLGSAGAVVGRLAEVSESCQGVLVTARHQHARAIVERDAEALDAVARQFEAMGAWLSAAEAAAAAAGEHRRAGRSRAASRSGRWSRTLLERCEGAATPALLAAGAGGQLTPRERDIAHLASRGASNREIAESTGLSVRTVENHLQRVYEKLGVTRRGELSAVLDHSPSG